jgi:hypothetical protein
MGTEGTGGVGPNSTNSTNSTTQVGSGDASSSKTEKASTTALSGKTIHTATPNVKEPSSKLKEGISKGTAKTYPATIKLSPKQLDPHEASQKADRDIEKYSSKLFGEQNPVTPHMSSLDLQCLVKDVLKKNGINEYSYIAMHMMDRIHEWGVNNEGRLQPKELASILHTLSNMVDVIQGQARAINGYVSISADEADLVNEYATPTRPGHVDRIELSKKLAEFASTVLSNPNVNEYLPKRELMRELDPFLSELSTSQANAFFTKMFKYQDGARTVERLKVLCGALNDAAKDYTKKIPVAQTTQSAVGTNSASAEVIDIDLNRTTRAQFKEWLSNKVETTPLQALWESIDKIDRNAHEDLVNEIQIAVKEKLAHQQLTAMRPSITVLNPDIKIMAEKVAHRMTQVSGEVARFDKKNPAVYNPYALISFETLSERIAEGVQLVAHGKSLEAVSVYSQAPRDEEPTIETTVGAASSEVIDIDFDKSTPTKAQFKQWLSHQVETSSLQNLWESISKLNPSANEKFGLDIQLAVKEKLALQQLTELKGENPDHGPKAKELALRLTQVSGEAARFDRRNPDAFNPYALISFETLSERISEGVQLLAQNQSLNNLKVYK